MDDKLEPIEPKQEPEALISWDDETEQAVAEQATAAAAEQAAQKKKNRREFWKGFLGGLAGNIILSILLTAVFALLSSIFIKGEMSSSEFMLINLFSLVGWILPFLANVAALIILLVTKRKWMAYGLLALWGVGLALTLILGVVLMMVCFATEGGGF